MICIAYLHGSSLARCKSANLIAEGPLVKLTIAVVVGTTFPYLPGLVPGWLSFCTLTTRGGGYSRYLYTIILWMVTVLSEQPTVVSVQLGTGRSTLSPNTVVIVSFPHGPSGMKWGKIAPCIILGSCTAPGPQRIGPNWVKCTRGARLRVGAMYGSW